VERIKSNREGGARPAVWAAAVFALVIIIGISLATAAFSRPQSCAACHQMRSRVTSWQAGIHGKKKVGCLDCHARQGWAGQAWAHIEGAKYVLAYFSKTPLQSDVSNDRCLTCHFPKNKRSSDKTAKLHFTEFLDPGVKCSDCHRALAHTAAGAAKTKSLDPSLCGGCHPIELFAWRQSAKQRPIKCGDCHGRAVPHATSPHRANAPRHNLAAATCLSCHGPSTGRSLWETSSHAAPKNLKDLTSHARDLGVSGPIKAVTCAVCHDPHTAKIRTGPVGLCVTCHKETDMYSNGRSTVAGWPEPSFQKQHLDKKVSCIDCHISALPGGVSAGHRLTQHNVAATAVKCLSCHPGMDIAAVMNLVKQ
jgi:nitrate/TMAO reductase-like tetraheme cytochrome c subunit